MGAGQDLLSLVSIDMLIQSHLVGAKTTSDVNRLTCAFSQWNDEVLHDTMCFAMNALATVLVTQVYLHKSLSHLAKDTHTKYLVRYSNRWYPAMQLDAAIQPVSCTQTVETLNIDSVQTK